MNSTGIWNKTRALFLAALMITSVFAGTITLSGAAVAQTDDTLLVDGDSNEGDFNTIQDAIDVANDNDTIVVQEFTNGTYGTFDPSGVSNLTIRSASGVTPTIEADGTRLIGSDDGYPGLEIRGFQINLLNGADIFVKSDDLTLADNEITVSGSSDYGIRVGDASGATITDNTWNIGAASTNVQGVLLTSTTDAEVSDNTFTGDTTGNSLVIPIQLATNAGDSTNTSVTGNSISGADFGILLDETTSQIQEVTIQDNTFGSDIGTGVAADEFTDDQSTDGFLINGEESDEAILVSLYENNAGLTNVSVVSESRTDEPGSPIVTNAELLDTDNDGDIDTVNVTFDEPVRDDSLAASDFQIGGQTFDSVSTVADGDAGAYDNKTQLTLDEGNEFDGTSLGNDSFGLQVFGESSTTDLAGNQVGTVDDSNVTDAAEPVVEGVSFSPTVINISNAQQATSQGVTITIEFSEPVQNFSTDDELPFDGLPDVSNAVIQSVNEETVTATADVGSLTDQDNLLDLAIVDEFQDNAGNAQIAFEQSNEGQSIYEIDVVRPELASNTITTIDSDNDGTVDQLEVEFNDNVSDSSVEPSDFTVSDPSATVESVDTGDVANDNIVILNVSGLPVNDTSVTPNVTVANRSIEDTAGNEGPDGDTTQESVDGAAPVVTELTVDDTGDSEGQTPTILINESDTPAPIQVQVDFSENLTSEPTAEVLNADGSSRTSTSTTDGSFDGDQITFDLDSDISDNDEETSLFVEVSGASDDSGNTLEAFNESRITVDTLAPQSDVDNSLADGLQNGVINISDNVSVTGDDIAQIQVSITDESGPTPRTFDSKSGLNDFLSSFNTTQFEDGTVTVAVNATDTAGNTGPTGSGTLDVDNTAPDVTINEPAETTAAPTDGTLSLNISVDEPNIDGNATITLEDDEGNVVVYNESVEDGDNDDITLRLNVSENATGDGARLPDLSETDENFSFDTQTVYDLSVTVNDSTGQSTTATQEDALFLDDTDPASLSLFAPDDPREVQGGDTLNIAYGYTENNTETVTVELVDEEGNVDRTITVDESQYVDDGVIKSFQLSADTVDFGDLDDGRYNVSVTVTDVAGNENTTSTDNAPIAVNKEDGEDGRVEFNSVDATAELNESSEEASVDVTYNISVTDLEDAGDLQQSEEQLENVTITPADGLIEVTVQYFDEDANGGEYVTETETVDVSQADFDGIEVVDNETVTATATVSVNVTETLTDSEDRILDYTVEVNGDVTVEANGTTDSNSSTESVSAGPVTLVENDPVEPEIESIEVDGDVGDNNQLKITFNRPVQATGSDVPQEAFAYQNVSDGSNVVTGVNVSGGEVTLTLNESVTPEDVGEDIVSLQDGSVLESDTSNVDAADPVAVPTDSGVIEENEPPALVDADVQANATKVVLTFDEPVEAGDGGALTAENFTYVDNNGEGVAEIQSVEHDAGTDTVVVTLNGSATTDDIDSDRIESDGADQVFDRFGNSDSVGVGLNEEIEPQGVEIVAPTEQLIRQSGDELQISYEYTENIPDGTDSVTVELINENDEVAATFEIDDSQYAGDQSVTKTIAIDLGEAVEGNLSDGTYSVKINVEDAQGRSNADTVSDVLVINDDAPEVSNVDVDRGNVAPDETIDVSYDYVNPGVNATNVTVTIAQAGDTVATDPQSIDSGSAEQTVQVDLSGLGIDDNEDYTVSVTVTDESGLNGTAESQPDALNVNANEPTIESVETNAGSNTVTVTFSEPVVAADGEVSLDDFAYQDVSDSGASAIESVADDGDSPDREIVLTLDSEVTAEDLGSDLVNVREDAIEDTDGGNAQQVPLNATALADTTDPTVDVTAPDISLSNDDSVPVSVNVGGEETSEVAVTLTGPDGTELSGSGLSPTLDATTLEDGTVTVSVTVTDAGGNTETGQTTVEKDTVRPTIESATTDVNSDQVTVTFSEPVTGVQVSDFDITSPAHRVASVSDTDDDATVTLVLNASVPAVAINNSELAVVSSTATDSLGNAADDESVLTDTGVPVIDSAEVGTNSSTITVDFDEPVEAGDGGALTADNFSYTGAGEIINVSHEAGASTATLVLSEPVTDAELGSAEVTAEDGAVVDLFDNSAVLTETVVDETAPSGVELVEPSGEVLKQSSDLLNVTYRYVENVPSNVDSVDITLTPTDGGESVTYQIDDTEYPDTAANKTLTLDLDSVVESELADGAYTVSIEVTDGSGNTNSASSEDAQVVINDDAPAVSDVSVDSASDVAPDETINVSYDYVNPGVNATSVTVHIVDTDDVSNFTNTDFANATFAQYVFDETERTPGTQTVTVDLSETPDDGSQLADNDDYVVFVTATDESGLSNLEAVLGGAQDSALLDVNANEPTLESVETNAGSNTVTVTFSEPVVAADGEISLDDFSYTDADGTTRIVNADAGGDSVVLTLSNDVDAESLGEDVVNVREDALEDTDGDNARQVPLNATALADTTAPTAEVSAEDVNAQNADTFEVDVTTEPLSEPTTITVTATGSDGETVSATASVTDDTTVALNVSALADGEVTISVEATDVAGNSGSQSTASTTVTKDTVAPTIESATTNAGTSTVDVTFSEPVTDVAANAFSITSPVHEVDSVSQQDATTVVLTLNRSVPPAAINVSGVQVSATGVSDSVGNDVTNEVNFTDVEAPSIAAVSAERNSSTVTVTFTEVITGGGESQNLTAEDFEYADNSNTSVSGIVSVNKTGPQTAVLTVNGSFTPSDLAEDTVAVAPESVFDTVDNAATSNAVGLGFEASLDASSTNDTVTIRVVTAQNITDAVDSLQVTERNVEFAELEGFETNDRFETSLNASEFTEVEPGVFETAIELPRDDTYTVSGVVSSTFQTETTTVDTSVPEPTDAVVLEVTSEAQLDDSRETTRLRVLFDEPIDASQISPDDITVGGLDGEIVAVQDAGAFGAVEVIVEGDLQTGDSPEISIAGSSYTDLNGTQGVENGSTVIHTDVVQLNEGVNLVSVPAASGSLDISELPLDAIESISRYNAETDSFEVFVPGAPNNPFTTLDGGEGYIIRLENGTTASVAINVANEPTGEGGPNSVDLSEGLNLIGHYQEDQQAVTTALSSVTAGQDGQFSDTVFTVLSQDEEAGGFTYESFRAGEFSTMEDGEAYWVFVTEDETYTEAPFDDR